MTNKYRYLLIVLSLLTLATSYVEAAPLRVTVVPWIPSQPDSPHLAVSGLPTTLQAIAEDGECNGRYEYRWDWNGDGDFADPMEGYQDADSAQYNGFFAPVGMTVTLPIHNGDRLFLPKLEVSCGAEKIRVVQKILSIGAQLCGDYFNGANSPECGSNERLNYTRSVYAARAIDQALWSLFLSFEHSSGDGFGHDQAHLCILPASKPMYALGHALNVFNRRGHGFSDQRDQNPYYRHASHCGLNAMLSTMQLNAIQFDDEDVIGLAGQALEFNANAGLSSSYWFSYESTAWVEPIALFGSADYVAEAGDNGVFGRTLTVIAQDLADSFIHCMGADSGWSYVCAGGVGTSNDASSNGWAPEALRLLERAFGIETYQAYRAGQKTWLEVNCPSGICPYHGGGNKLAGNALVGYGWVDQELFDVQSESGAAWQSLGDWYTGGQQWGLYFLYTAVKGMRSFTPELSILPNGIDFDAAMVDFFVTGEEASHSDATAKQAEDGSWNWIGDWVWGGQISQIERTAIITQMLQSWLEVFAYARAFPQRISPQEAVTFDHSWSHSVSSDVGITLYQWDVATYIDPNLPACPPNVSGCQDLNGDGDCADQGEMCNEDRNGDGVVSGDEIFWEFETADPDEQFTHRYDEVMTWGESRTHQVTLRITDSNGRIVEDNTSVEVGVALENHAPTIVSHPLGDEVFYTGHLDAFVTLDGRGSYDLDALRAPYPGDNGRPAGIRDSITSIDFDLNFDGDFNDQGEQGLNGPVRVLLPEDLELGDLIAIPIRVCDDGQWSNLCTDGIEQADCSLCSFGQAIIEFVPNQNAPVIDTCPEGEDCDNGYTAEIDGNNVGDVQLDLSESYDPDGDLGLTYTYEVIEGEGEFIEDGDFDGDMGDRPIYRPIGEGERTDQIRVTVTDSTGLSSEAIILVHLPNITPETSWGDFDIQLNPPLIIRAEGRNEWSGRFRVVVDARVIHGAGVVARPITRDAGDDYTVYLDFDDDGQADQTLSKQELEAGDSPYPLDDGYSSLVNVWCIDDDAAESNTSTLQLNVPNKSDNLIYRFDVGNDGTFEEDGTLDNFYTFFENDPNIPSIPIAIEVIDDLGATATTVVEVSLLNRPPIFIQTSQIEEGYSVTFVTSATDPDLDRLSYSFDAGHGAAEEVNESGVFVYTYPAEQASYEASVTVSDGRGGEATHTFEVSFLPPVDLPPVIDLFSVTAAPGGESEALVEAHDPEGQNIVVSLDWGDGAESSRVVGGRASRRLAYQAETYRLTATVTDPGGQEDIAQLDLQLEDAPTIISSAQQSQLSNGERMFTVIARDLDSAQLEYYWDYDGDGQWDDEATAPNVANHLYPDRNAYTARIGVRDPWSGTITETTIEVPSTEPLPPEIIDVSLTIGFAGQVRVVIEASDPEGERLDYFVTWGDRINEQAELAPLGIGTHEYALRANPYVLTARVVDPDGLSAEREVLVQIQDAPTIITARGSWIEGTLNYNLGISASDPDQEQLTYFWDFNNDGQWDLADQVDRTLVHVFDDIGPYEVRVGAKDNWSGEIAETVINLEANQAPKITDIRLTYSPRGHVDFEVDAYDPEGTPLKYDILWGDEELVDGEPLPWARLNRDAANHDYAYSDSNYRGTIKVTDGSGLSAQAPFTATILDASTEILELTLTQLGAGEVELRVNASDQDSPDQLRFSFDMDNSGMWTPEEQLEPSTRRRYERAGVYPLKVKVLDPWSGRSIEAELNLNLPPWVSEAINEDHVIGEEGSCVVFRANTEGNIESKVDPSICDRLSELDDEDRLWIWRFGDGEAREGQEVGHRYQDDGVYQVELEKREPTAPLRSTIQAYISNVAPHFTSETMTDVVAGETYRYEITADDPGLNDELKLQFSSSIPEGMTLSPIEGSPRSWEIIWESPRLDTGREIFIELKLIDGHQTGDEWVPDGGEAYQRFILRVAPSPFDPFATGDFAGTGHGPQGCDQNTSSSTLPLVFIMLFVLLLKLRESQQVFIHIIKKSTVFSILVFSLMTHLAVFSPNAHAQDLQLFTPASGDWNYVSLDGARLIKPGKWALSTAVSHGRNPLVKVDANGNITEIIVDYVSALELSGVIGLTDWLEVGLHVPYLHSSGLSQPYPVDDANGVGDLRLSTKFGLIQSKGNGFALALNWLNHLPGGDGEREGTRRFFTTEPRLSAEYRHNKFRSSLNLAYRYLMTNRELGRLEGSSAPMWGLGLAYQIKPTLELVTEAHQRLMTFERSPFESSLALRIRPNDDKVKNISVTLGGGFGLGTDMGSVEMRLFAMLTYQASEQEQTVNCSGQAVIHSAPSYGDQDQDGISDQFDRCPKLAEDRDGFEDTDGCPDVDNDHDGIKDQDDRCPNQAETVNGFEDTDGCPDQKASVASTVEDEHADEGQLLDITERVFFKHNESVLLPKSYPILNQVAALLIKYPQIEELRVEGHTDDTGTREKNLKLSNDRAAAVKQYLISKGIAPKRLISKGYGDTRPIASNDTDAGRALNRRVNFRIIKGPQEIFVIAESSNDQASKGQESPVPTKTQVTPIQKPSVKKTAQLKAVKDPFADEEEPAKQQAKVEAKKQVTKKQVTKKQSVKAKKATAKASKASVKVNKIARYSVQVKASTRLKDAQKFTADLDKERLKNYTLSHRGSDKRVVHRVRLGPYKTRAKAEEAMARYQDRFPKSGGCFIVKVSLKEAKNAQ